MCNDHAKKVAYMKNLWSDVTPESFLATLSDSDAPKSVIFATPLALDATNYTKVGNDDCDSSSNGDADSYDGTSSDDEDLICGGVHADKVSFTESEIRQATAMILDLVNERNALVAIINTTASVVSSSSSSGSAFCTELYETPTSNDENVHVQSESNQTSPRPQGAVVRRIVSEHQLDRLEGPNTYNLINQLKSTIQSEMQPGLSAYCGFKRSSEFIYDDGGSDDVGSATKKPTM